MLAKKISLPPVLERHELKYLVPLSLVEPISQFIAPYCQLDYYSTNAFESFYQVNSLYFDTRDCQFFEQRLYGKASRFNMRVRTYASGEAPYFLEIKHKRGSSVKKYRATISEHEWPGILTDPNYRIPKTDSLVEKRNKELFMRLAHSYSIEPKIYTQYQRRAFFSTVDDYARVTMDKNMKYRPQEDNSLSKKPYSLQPDDSLTNYDDETIYANNTYSDASVVLELKSNIGQVPMWMLDLIQHFQLKQVGFSKYLKSTLVSREGSGIIYMLGDRASCCDY